MNPTANVVWSRGLWLGATLAGIGAAAVAWAASGQQPMGSEQLQQLRNLGKAHYEESQYAEAIAAFRRVSTDAAATGQDHLNLALGLYRNRDDPASAVAAAQAGEVAPELAGVPYLRGLIGKRAGDMQAARADLEAARDLDPTDPAIRYNLGAVLAQLGDEQSAGEEFEIVIGMGFDVALQHYVSALYRQFQALLRRGDRDAAAPLIELHRQASPRLSQAARSASALEQSRNTRVLVPNVSLTGARPETAAAVRFTDAGAGAARATGATLVVGDINGDGRSDWVTTGTGGSVWLSSESGFATVSFATPSGPAALGDFDRDGAPDLYLAHPEGDRLYRNVAGETEPGSAPFVEVAPVGLPTGGAPNAVLWLDFDHDGDLDVFVAHGEISGEPVADRMLRNQGGGEFVDVTEAAGLDAAAVSFGAEWGDIDGDNDVDLYVWRRGGNALYSNERGGRFVEIGAAVGAAGGGGTRQALVEDLDNDGHLDLLLAGAPGLTLLRNTGAGTFDPTGIAAFESLAPVPAATPSRAAELADLNNDGYLDVVVATAEGLVFLVNEGGLAFSRFEPLAAAGGVPDLVAALAGGSAAELVGGDLDGDGAVDLLVAGEERMGWLAQEAPAGGWITLNLTGIKNNLRGIGARVEVKAGGLYQMRPLRGVPLHFGLGDAGQLDVLRIRWPNGIVQNLLEVTADARLSTTELERLEGSCPFLYTWDGRQWRFVNEVLGIAPLGMPLSEGVFHSPDADEYIPVPGGAMVAQDGVFEIRLTEELRETGYIDAVRLLAVDRPRRVNVVVNERFSAPPHPEFRLFLVEQMRPVRAVDHRGHDWTAALAAVDEEWAVPFEPGPYDGMATPHELSLELDGLAPGPSDEPIHLHLTGWVYWAMGSINLAADQDPRYEFTPVSLDVGDGSDGWQSAIADIGLPNAKNSTLVVDLTQHLRRDDPRVRLRTTMRLYWDAVKYVVGGDAPYGVVPVGDWQGAWGVPRAGRLRLGPGRLPATGPTESGGNPRAGRLPLDVRVLAPASATLRDRGFSALTRTHDGYETFDYAEVLREAPWDQHRGYYTRFGAVDELVVSADDRYVIVGTGDELAVRFVDALPPVRPGWRRDYLVYLNGWVKDGDLNTVYGDRVEPLPFHAMSGYPYAPGESYPDDEASRRFLERWVTRPARLINQPLR